MDWEIITSGVSQTPSIRHQPNRCPYLKVARGNAPGCLDRINLCRLQHSVNSKIQGFLMSLFMSANNTIESPAALHD